MAKEHELIKGEEYYLDQTETSSGFFEKIEGGNVFFKRGRGIKYYESTGGLINFPVGGYDYRKVERKQY